MVHSMLSYIIQYEEDHTFEMFCQSIKSEFNQGSKFNIQFIKDAGNRGTS